MKLVRKLVWSIGLAAVLVGVGCSSDSSSSSDPDAGGSGGGAGEGGSGGAGGSSGVGGSAGEGDGSGGGGAPPFGAPGPSCNGMDGTECQGKSCCSSLLVPGGSFPMGRSTDGADMCRPGLACGGDEEPEHEVTVSAFYLDEFEVTVGRFRRFVEQYDGTVPVEGVGAHPKIAGSGWQAAWNSHYHATREKLVSAIKCNSSYQTWRDSPSGTEQHPMNCVNWYEAFAFCAWDGGRLPTEAEWEKAAAGGDENRLYPWGMAEADITRASYECRYDGKSGCTFADIAQVGSFPAGQGRWGHKDLAGNLWEWVLDWYQRDWYAGQGNACIDCANLNQVSRDSRVVRGGVFASYATSLCAATRFSSAPTDRDYDGGFRCARTH